MAKNEDLGIAKANKKDEFYTQFYDIEKEVNAYLETNPDVFRGKTILLPCDDPEWSNFTLYFAQSFQSLGLKKLISTSYANDSKNDVDYCPTKYEINSPNYNATLNRKRGKIFVLDNDVTGDNVIDKNDIHWDYLESDGDFRSEEVTKLRDEADVIITNCPFSLFREFLSWILEGKKQFLILGNINAVTYKDVFHLIMNNEIWLGYSIHSGDREFRVPDNYPLKASGSRIDENGNKYIRVKGVRWFTNIDHGGRHQPLSLMSMADNLKYTKHKSMQGMKEYNHYDNYDAIEIPYTDAIPSDYDGVMGVPITFIDKFCPEQFEIIGIAKRGAGDPKLKTRVYTATDFPNYSDLNAGPTLFDKEGNLYNTYPRILIKTIKNL